MGGTPAACPFSLTASLSPPPVPISAQWTDASKTCTITFDIPLDAAASIDIPNWRLLIRGNMMTLTTAAINGAGQVELVSNTPPGGPGTSVVDYNPPPFDVLATGAAPVATFAAFPISTIP